MTNYIVSPSPCLALNFCAASYLKVKISSWPESLFLFLGFTCCSFLLIILIFIWLYFWDTPGNGDDRNRRARWFQFKIGSGTWEIDAGYRATENADGLRFHYLESCLSITSLYALDAIVKIRKSLSNDVWECSDLIWSTLLLLATTRASKK